MSVRNDIITGLKTTVETLKTASAYSAAGIKSVDMFRSNYLQTDQAFLPIVMVVDNGNDTVIVNDGTRTRYSVDVTLWAYCRGYDWPDAQSKLNEVIAAIRALINSVPTIHSQVLAWQHVDNAGHDFDQQNKGAHTAVRTRLIYYATNGTY